MTFRVVHYINQFYAGMGGETGPAVKVQAPCEGIIAFQGPGTGLFFGFRFPE
jgi:hypothetical protein